MGIRNKARFLVSAAAGVALALASLAGADRPAEPVTHTVVIEGMKFVPNTVQIAPGDRILFRNNDLFPHTATAKESHSFDSGPIKPGASWTVQPAGPQTITFVCLLHPTMTGTIVIKQP
jgi:plastocyanin